MNFAVSDVSEGEMGKFGCNIMDYEEKILTPFIENVQKAEELRGLVSLLIDEQEIFARADAGKSTIEKIKSREKLPLNGSISLKIDEFEYDLNFNGLIDLSNPFDSYPPTLKACFGKPEICDYINVGSPFFYTWFLTKMVIEKEARIVIGRFEMKLSIKGDLGSTLGKILRDETFQADLKYQIDSDESYVRINYHGKTSTSKFSVMMSKISGPRNFYHQALEYFYNQASEIFAVVNVDNTKYYRARGCSEDLCNDPKRHFLDISPKMSILKRFERPIILSDIIFV